MKDFYKEISIIRANKKEIVLSTTESRLFLFNIFFGILSTVLVGSFVLKYNSLEYDEILIALGFVIITYIIAKTSRWICYKEIVFDRLSGKVYYKRNIPRERYIVMFSTLEWTKIDREDKDIIYHEYYINNNKFDFKKLLCSAETSYDVESFFKNYMNSVPKFLKEFVEFELKAEKKGLTK